MRDLEAICISIARGEEISKEEKAAFLGHARESGVVPKASSAKKEPSNGFLLDKDVPDEIKDSIRELVAVIAPTLDGSQTYFNLAFDHRGFGNARTVEMWKIEPVTKDGEAVMVEKLDDEGEAVTDKDGEPVMVQKTENNRQDDWNGARGYEAVDLSE